MHGFEIEVKSSDILIDYNKEYPTEIHPRLSSCANPIAKEILFAKEP
jgi:hypothetical protein